MEIYSNKTCEIAKSKYTLTQNSEFIKWFEMGSKENNYYYSDINLKLSSYQKIIDDIVSWYRFKYPSTISPFYNNLIDNSCTYFTNMPIDQLLSSFHHDDLAVLFPNYLSRGSYCHNDEFFISMTIYKKNLEKISYLDSTSIRLVGSPFTGILQLNDELSEKIGIDTIHIEKFYECFKNFHSDFYDISEVEEVLNRKKFVVELRERILNFSILKMIYSTEMDASVSINIANNMINEFNNKFNVNLSIDVILYMINSFENDNVNTNSNSYFAR